MAEGYHRNGKPDLEWWIAEVQKGIQFRKRMAYEERWSTWRSWYRGQFERGQLPSNIYFKAIRTMIPRVYFRNPSVSITATQPGLQYFLLAKLLERIDNKLIDHIGLKGQMKKTVLKASMFGTGIICRGFGAEYTPTPADITTEAPDVGTRRMRERVEYNTLVRPNQPWALDTHPRDFVVPAWCEGIEAARWTCRQIVRTKQDILDDPRLKNKDALEAAYSNFGPGRGRPPGSLISSPMTERDRQGIRLWEIRDKKTEQVFVIAPFTSVGVRNSLDEPLFIGDDKLQRNNRLPAYPLVFNQDDEQFWGVPDSMIIEPQQYEKNEIRSQIRTHRRILLKKMLYLVGTISPDELSKLLADDNVDIGIGVKDINGIKPLEAGQLPPGLLEADNLIEHEVETLLGLGVNQFGEYAPGSADRSATESNIVNQATQIRADERRDSAADLLVNLTQDMNDDIIEYWGEDMVADVAGPAGVPIWIKFHPEMLRQVQWDVKVDPDSAVPLTKQYREAKATQLYGALYGKNQQVNQEALTHFFLSEMYGSDADSILTNPVMQTTQQQPMLLPQAMQHIAQLPGRAQPQNQPASPGLTLLPGGQR